MSYSIDEVNEMLDIIADEIPESFYYKLSGGIILSEDVKYHPDFDSDDMLVLGHYERGPFGSSIVIFYGSFMQMYSHLPKDLLMEKLRDTLLHEFRHHLEYLSGMMDLEIEDRRYLDEYKRKSENE